MLRFIVMKRGARWNQSEFLFDLLAVCAVTVILIAGLLVRARLPAVPLADGDTWGYLRPALYWLSGLGFEQTYGRDWLYPALVAGILNVTGNFCAITYVQRFLGLAAIVIFWLTWRSWLRLLPVQRWPWRWACLVVMLLLLSLYALSLDQAFLENSIRPEGVLAFFELVYLYCLTSFFLARWRWQRTGSSIAFGAATFGVSYLILLLKPSWGFSLGFTFLALVAGAFGKASPIVRFAPLLGATAAFALLFSLPKVLGFQKEVQLFLPVTLVSIHAKQILETTPVTVSTGVHNSGVPDQMFYEELRKAYSTAQHWPNGYPSLGFQPDYILYVSGFFDIIQQKQGWSNRELAAACYLAYFRAWLQVPSSMLGKIAKQTTLFLFPRSGDFYSSARPIDLDKLTSSRRSLPDCQLSPEMEKVYQSYKEGLKRVEQNRYQLLEFPVLAKISHIVALAAFWLQLVFFAAITIICSRPKRRALRSGGLAILLVVMAVYGNAMTFAVVHSLDTVRYRIGYTPGFLLELAVIVGFLLILPSKTLDRHERIEEPAFADKNPVRTSG